MYRRDRKSQEEEGGRRQNHVIIDIVVTGSPVLFAFPGFSTVG